MKQAVERVKDALRLHDSMIIVATGLILGPLVTLGWVLAADQSGWKADAVLTVVGGLGLALLIMFALATIQVFAGGIYGAVVKGKNERAAKRGDVSAMDKLPPREWGPGTWRRTARLKPRGQIQRRTASEYGGGVRPMSFTETSSNSPHSRSSPPAKTPGNA